MAGNFFPGCMKGPDGALTTIKKSCPALCECNTNCRVPVVAYGPCEMIVAAVDRAVTAELERGISRNHAATIQDREKWWSSMSITPSGYESSNALLLLNLLSAD